MAFTACVSCDISELLLYVLIFDLLVVQLLNSVGKFRQSLCRRDYEHCLLKGTFAPDSRLTFRSLRK